MVRRLARLIVKIHNPPTNSPPEPLPSPCATGSTACQVDIA